MMKATPSSEYSRTTFHDIGKVRITWRVSKSENSYAKVKSSSTIGNNTKFGTVSFLMYCGNHSLTVDLQRKEWSRVPLTRETCLTHNYTRFRKNQAITTAAYFYSQFNFLISSCLITIEHLQPRGVSIIREQNLL